MDPDFMTRYLRDPQQDADRGAGESRDDERVGKPVAEPVAEPEPPTTPVIDEPGAELEKPATRDRETAVLPPVPPAPAPERHGPGSGPGQSPPPAGDPAERTTPVSATTPPRKDVTSRVGQPVNPTPPPAGHLSARPEQQSGRAWPANDTRIVMPGRHQARPRPPAPSTGPQWAVDAGQQRVGTGPQRVADPMPDASPWDQSPQGAHSPAWAPQSAPHLRVDELVKTRKLPPEMGWRKAVYAATGHLVNLGAGPAERSLRDQITQIRTNIPGNYQIGVVSMKGGVGKTRTTAGIGTAYGLYRNEPVLAIDANPTYGCLGRLIDPHATASIREFMADDEVTSYPKARHYTGKNAQGLEVLAGNQNVANPLSLSAELFNDTLGRTRQFYQLSLIDCGPHIEHHVMRGVLASVDALVIVGSMNFDGAAAAELTIDWLAARNAHDLLRRSVVVLNDVHRCENKKFVTAVRHSLGPRVGEVKTIPWDQHLRDGATLDFDALAKRTRLAYIEVAAWLAQGFAAAGAGAR